MKKREIIENSGNPKWGLFDCSFWKHPIRWLKDLHIYHQRIRYIKKYGFSPVAEYETFDWFIDVMRRILYIYRYKRCGNKYWLDEPYNPDDEDQEKRNIDFFNSELDKMLNLLDLMDERKQDSEPTTLDDLWEEDNRMQKSCDKFFRLFAKYFYGLWD